jgi:hypothetical protein
MMASKTVPQDARSPDVKKISDLLAMEEYLDVDLPVPTFVEVAHPTQEVETPAEI